MDKPSAIGLIIGFVSYMVWFLGCDQREPQTRPVRATRLMSLHESALRGDDPAIFRAAGLNPDLDGRDGDGRTPLMLAAIYDRKIFAEHLISMGADLEAADPDGRTALHLAVLNDSDVFDLLVSRGARTDAVDHAGETPLHYALRFRRPHLFERLMLEASLPELNRANREGVTPLVMALLARMTSAAQRLVEAGADIERATSAGVTPLMLAANGGHHSTPGLVRLLLDKGARLEVRDVMGRSALYYAIGKIWVDTTALLLEAGADHRTADRTGRTLRDYLKGDGERADRDRILALLDAVDAVPHQP